VKRAEPISILREQVMRSSVEEFGERVEAN